MIDSTVSRHVTAELLARYDRPGPRYTSYPTAVEFHDGITLEDYESRLAAADALGDAPLSLYVHLPFCEHRCLFCGCHVIISPHKERAAPYLDLLEREIAMLARRLPHRRRFSQLHLGGGTPTYYTPEQLTRFLTALRAEFEPTPDAEIAVEVDPRVTTPEHLDALAAQGFNRVSMGVQDFTPQVQEAIERIQSAEATASLIDHARGHGFAGVNVDLIYGLPFQTPETFEETVRTVIDLEVDRAAVYSFAFVPWMRAHMKKLVLDALPDRETKFLLFAAARERFLNAGYQAIGMDHFARPEDELSKALSEGRLRRNFQGYTVIPAEDVIGLGISAIGDMRGAYIQNEKKLSDYEQAIAGDRLPVSRGVIRTEDDEIRRVVIAELMCNFEVRPREIEQSFGIDFPGYFRVDLEDLEAYEAEGLVEVTPEAIRATPTGRLFVRNLAMCFDRYYREKHRDGAKPVFSRTV